MIPNQLEHYTFRRYKQVLHMSDREIIVPPTLQSIMDRAGYAPAVRVGDTLYCAGQVGRTRDMEVILNPEAQFIACWENLRTVLAEGGCTFDDIVGHDHLSRRHERTHAGVPRREESHLPTRSVCLDLHRRCGTGTPRPVAGDQMHRGQAQRLTPRSKAGAQRYFMA